MFVVDFFKFFHKLKIIIFIANKIFKIIIVLSFDVTIGPNYLKISIGPNNILITLFGRLVNPWKIINWRKFCDKLVHFSLKAFL